MGETAAVTLRTDSGLKASGALLFDATTLQAASGGTDAGSGRIAFQLEPRGELVVVFRVLPAAAGQSVSVQTGALTASTPDGAAASLEVDGMAQITVPPVDEPRRRPGGQP